MNNLLSKFQEICNDNITLPDGGDIKINKLNVDFQSKLHTRLENSENDFVAILTYMDYINEYITGLYRDYNFTYRDKLYILNYWFQDIHSLDNFNLNTKAIDKLNDSKIELQLNNNNIVVKLQQSNLQLENKILQFLLSKPSKSIGRMSIIFFDTCRFIHSVEIDGQEFFIENMSVEEFYKIYELFSVDHLKQITDKLTEILQELSIIRELEADITSFY